MKNIVYYFLLVVVLVSGCTKKTDQVFNQTVDQRLDQTLTALQKNLTAAPGWKLFVYPKGLEESQKIKVGGLSYYVKFTDSNRVTMVSDFNTSIATTPKQSGYR